jgi:hypothetical protein
MRFIIGMKILLSGRYSEARIIFTPHGRHESTAYVAYKHILRYPTILKQAWI